MTLARQRWLLTVLLCATAVIALRAVAFPPAQGYINDVAEVLDESTEQELRTLLRETEAQTTAEIAVATVLSLEGLTIEDYAVQLFKEWGVGQKSANNGVLILVAPRERQVRIEVGYGLEGILPDGLAGEIVRKQFIPKFRQSDFNGGVREGVRRIAAIVREGHVFTDLERERLPAATPAAAAVDPRTEWIMIPFVGLFVAVGSIGIGLGIRTKTIGAIMFGLVMGGGIAVVGWLTLPAWSWTILLPLAVALMVLGFVKGGRASWRSMVRSTSPSRGWEMGSGGSSSSSSGSDSGSSSSSSDSFGGGSSGGGGASGSW